MKFNGEVWVRMLVTDQIEGEPDEFVVVKNKKGSAGIIPYARYGNNWTTVVPARVLIRCLATALENKGKRYVDRFD